MNSSLEKGTNKATEEDLNKLIEETIKKYGFVVFAKRLQAYRKEHVSNKEE